MVRFFFGSNKVQKQLFGLLSRYAGLDKNQSRHEQQQLLLYFFLSFFKTATGIFWRVPKHHLSGELFKHLMEKRSKNTHPNSYPDTSKIELKNEGQNNPNISNRP